MRHLKLPTRSLLAPHTVRLTLLSLALLGAGCTGKYVRPTTSEKIDRSAERVARGQYLVDSIGACGACHTPRVGNSWLGGERADAYLAGGAVFSVPTEGFKVSIPNITPDGETGIGRWTDDQLMRALRDGIHRDEDRMMVPPMPFYMYDQMSDEDARSIVAYLRSVPPIKNKVTPVRELPFMMKAVMKFGGLHHKPVTGLKTPDAKDKKKYGHYLARIGLCTDCHSFTSTGPDEEDQLLGGSTAPFEDPEYGKIWARNLTSHKETGLGKFSKAQIIEALRSGRRLDGKKMAPPMTMVIPHLATWNDEDLDALVTFIQSVPVIENKVPDPELTPAARKQVDE